MAEKGKPPIKKFRAGNVKIAIWEEDRTSSDGRAFKTHNATLTRSYRKKDSEDWVDETIHVFNVKELAKISAVVSKAMDFLLDTKEE